MQVMCYRIAACCNQSFPDAARKNTTPRSVDWPYLWRDRRSAFLTGRPGRRAWSSHDPFVGAKGRAVLVVAPLRTARPNCRVRHPHLWTPRLQAALWPRGGALALWCSQARTNGGMCADEPIITRSQEWAASPRPVAVAGQPDRHTGRCC